MKKGKTKSVKIKGKVKSKGKKNGSKMIRSNVKRKIQIKEIEEVIEVIEVIEVGAV